MIAKCSLFSILFVVVSALPRPTGFEFPSTDCDCQSQSSPISLVPSGSSFAAINRNLIGKGKFPVALRNRGPNPDFKIPITTSHYTAPVQEKPTIRLPAKIPAPRVISHTCTCYRTVLQPPVQPCMTSCAQPVVERFQFEAEANNCQSPVQVFPAVQGVQPIETFPGVQPALGTVTVPQFQQVDIPFQDVQVPQNFPFGSTFGC